MPCTDRHRQLHPLTQVVVRLEPGINSTRRRKMAERTQTWQLCGWFPDFSSFVPNFPQDEEDEEESDNEDSEDEHEAALECDPERCNCNIVVQMGHSSISWVSCFFMAIFHEEIWLEYDDQSMVQFVIIIPSCLRKARNGSWFYVYNLSIYILLYTHRYMHTHYILLCRPYISRICSGHQWGQRRPHTLVVWTVSAPCRKPATLWPPGLTPARCTCRQAANLGWANIETIHS